MFHNRLKHINIKYHSLRNLIENGDLQTGHVPENMITDVLTKDLQESKHYHCVNPLGF